MLDFYPNTSPREMVELGVFGGSYFGPNAGPELGDEQEKLIKSIFKGIDIDLYKADKYSIKKNKFKIRSGMPYKYWLDMNWFHHRDPFGWFEWYCKYTLGQRGEDDDRQIRRWQDFAGRNGRWRNNIYKKVYETKNWNVSPRIQQSLLHWGYQINTDDYQMWCKLNNKK